MKRPMLTQREAATACGVSRSTIRRRREAGDLPNAVQDESRGWLIPVEDLLAAGFRLNAPSGPDVPAADSAAAGTGGHHQEHGHGQGDDVATLRAELERQRQDHVLAVAAERHGRELAEAEAAHLREQLGARAEHIADLQQALRALTPAPGPYGAAAVRPRAGGRRASGRAGTAGAGSGGGRRGASPVVAARLTLGTAEGAARGVSAAPSVSGSGRFRGAELGLGVPSFLVELIGWHSEAAEGKTSLRLRSTSLAVTFITEKAPDHPSEPGSFQWSPVESRLS
ncbi:helix-turn-helix transcriptional regulator [Streptomyces griseus]|uniref:helix-turn-helix transcriptional regulator n=1 Tax=Streptomyces griseus TaxID=1911 RepID=UPI0037BC7E2A